MNEQEKLEALQQMTGLDVTALGAAKKAEAEDAGRESKEVKEEVVPEPVAETASEQGGLVLTPELIGQALATIMQPVFNRLDELEKAVGGLEEKETDDPYAAMMHSFKSSVIGQPDAKVDGRTKEAKDAPLERANGFPPGTKLNNDGYAATSVNRIFGGQLAKELAERGQ